MKSVLLQDKREKKKEQGVSRPKMNNNGLNHFIINLTPSYPTYPKLIAAEPMGMWFGNRHDSLGGHARHRRGPGVHPVVLSAVPCYVASTKKMNLDFIGELLGSITVLSLMCIVSLFTYLILVCFRSANDYKNHYRYILTNVFRVLELPGLVFAGVIACQVGAGAGYACTGHDRATEQHFASPDGSAVGMIRGWFSNCYDMVYQCSSTTSCSSTGTSQSCITVPVYCTMTLTDKHPWDYVQAFAELVEGCGWVLTATSTNANLRRIQGQAEHTYWVKVLVSAFNTTTGLDPRVNCLHQLG